MPVILLTVSRDKQHPMPIVGVQLLKKPLGEVLAPPAKFVTRISIELYIKGNNDLGISSPLKVWSRKPAFPRLYVHV